MQCENNFFYFSLVGHPPLCERSNQSLLPTSRPTLAKFLNVRTNSWNSNRSISIGLLVSINLSTIHYLFVKEISPCSAWLVPIRSAVKNELKSGSILWQSIIIKKWEMENVWWMRFYLTCRMCSSSFSSAAQQKTFQIQKRDLFNGLFLIYSTCWCVSGGLNVKENKIHNRVSHRLTIINQKSQEEKKGKRSQVVNFVRWWIDYSV